MLWARCDGKPVWRDDGELKMAHQYELAALIQRLQVGLQIPRAPACRAAGVGPHTFNSLAHIERVPLDKMLKLARVVLRYVPPGHDSHRRLVELIGALE